MRSRLFLTWAAAAFVLALLLAAALPLLLGGTSMTVLSGSMTPAIRTGDVVAVRPIPPSVPRSATSSPSRIPTAAVGCWSIACGRSPARVTTWR